MFDSSWEDIITKWFSIEETLSEKLIERPATPGEIVSRARIANTAANKIIELPTKLK
jgi:hypothetical protein